MKLLDNYERSTGVAEKVTADEVTENNSFLDAILETEVMKVEIHHHLDSLNNTNYTVYFTTEVYNKLKKFIQNRK